MEPKFYIFREKKIGVKKLFFKLFSESEVEELGFLRIFRKTWFSTQNHTFEVKYRLQKNSLRKYWSKSWKSKNWVNVSNFNFWLKEDIRNVKNTICRFLRNKKSLKINFTKKLFFATYIWPQKYGFGSKIMFFWKSSKNRVLRLQTPKKSLKNNFLTPIFFSRKI